MLLRKLMKSSAAMIRSYGAVNETPSPEASLEAPIHSMATPVQLPPTILSPPTLSAPTISSVQPPLTTISSPTTTDPTNSFIEPFPVAMSQPKSPTLSTADSPSPCETTDTRASNICAPEPPLSIPIRTPNPTTATLPTPMRAPQRFDHASTPLSSPLARKLHTILDKQCGLSRGYESREAEIAKTRELIQEMTKPSKVTEQDPQTVDAWLAIQYRWIQWLVKDMKTLMQESKALEQASKVLRAKIQAENKRLEVRGVGGDVGEVKETAKAEALPRMLAKLGLEEEEKAVEVVKGGSDGREQKVVGKGANGKSERRKA